MPRGGSKPNRVGQVAKEACQQYPTVPSKTLARFLVEQNPGLFNNDIELARERIRYYRGSLGKRMKDMATRSGSLVPSNVKFPRSHARVRHPYILPPGRWAILSDVHVPLHDTKAVKAAVAEAKRRKATGVLLNGDAQDCEAISTWEATGHRDFVMEVGVMIDFLGWLRAQFKDRPIVWKPGNHEDRLRRYYQANAPHLAELPTANMEVILALEERGIEYLEHSQRVQAGYLTIYHGHEIRGGSTAVNPSRWLFLRAKECALCGHLHQTSHHEEPTASRKIISCWSSGCLCDLSPPYAPEGNKWNHGFVILNLHRSGNFEIDNIRMVERRVV